MGRRKKQPGEESKPYLYVYCPCKGNGCSFKVSVPSLPVGNFNVLQTDPYPTTEVLPADWFQRGVTSVTPATRVINAFSKHLLAGTDELEECKASTLAGSYGRQSAKGLGDSRGCTWWDHPERRGRLRMGLDAAADPSVPYLLKPGAVGKREEVPERKRRDLEMVVNEAVITTMPLFTPGFLWAADTEEFLDKEHKWKGGLAVLHGLLAEGGFSRLVRDGSMKLGDGHFQLLNALKQRTEPGMLATFGGASPEVVSGVVLWHHSLRCLLEEREDKGGYVHAPAVVEALMNEVQVLRLCKLVYTATALKATPRAVGNRVAQLQMGRQKGGKKAAAVEEEEKEEEGGEEEEEVQPEDKDGEGDQVCGFRRGGPRGV
ncbi:hypothetical protein DUNSADRAFT_296 [Dunaliella salina]|uniref:Uncharacterized protein n=1 Tax=Dunaliella salina TaxID=3046 RepID=A0ABQ7GYG5_DUNSA|nr:hypothetical protein DUNSADRAFT_296 [Dunaliella salina]|eukprot:KAF5839640.1 hypothetical protein DUNSADRAFT_296 [Dunaliella salina]